MNIQVITGDGQPLGHQYMLSMMVDLWRDAGHTVAIGNCDVLDSDIGVVHIDRTVVDPSWLPANPHHRPLINAAALDISKHRVSRMLVTEADGYDGPVIVKTNDNSSSSGERTGLGRWEWARVRRRLTDHLPWAWIRTLPKTYPVLDHPERVPGWVWRRRDLVVEQFVAEREGDEYVLRNWMFFGDHEYATKSYSADPVVKFSNTRRYDYIDEIPESLRERRRDLGIEYGKFDFVMRDGEAILLDANKTPVSQRTPTSPGPNITHLAEAIERLAGAAS